MQTYTSRPFTIWQLNALIEWPVNDTLAQDFDDVGDYFVKMDSRFRGRVDTFLHFFYEPGEMCDLSCPLTPAGLMEETERLVREFTPGEYSQGVSFGPLCGEPITLRLLRLVREGVIAPKWVKYHVNGKTLPITEDGDFLDPWPGGFFGEWRAKELF